LLFVSVRTARSGIAFRRTIARLERVGGAEEKADSIEQNYQKQYSEVESARDNPTNGKRLAAKFRRVVLDLHQRNNSQHQRNRRRQNSEVTTQPKCDASNSQNKRSHCETLLWLRRVGRRWRWGPTRLNRRRRNVLGHRRRITPGHVERRLFGRTNAGRHGLHQCRRRFLCWASRIDQRRAVLSAEGQPLIDEFLIAFGTAAHSCSGQWSVVSGQWSVVSGQWSGV